MNAFEHMEGKIWYNGEVVAWKDAKIHVLTHGLHYGSSVFEGIRIYNGKPFKVCEHLDRLHHSASCLGFTIPFSTGQLVAATHTQIELNKIINGYARPVAWRGTETMLIGGGSKTANTAIAVWPTFDKERQELRESGSRLCISAWRKPAANASPYSAKAASIYTLCTIVKNQAVELGYDDAIMLDNHGNITEGTTSNFFMIIDNELHTPVADCFLNGITRQTVIELAHDQGIKVHERHIKPQELESIQAAFLTGTAIEIMPIRAIENHRYDTQHPLLKNLMQSYSDLVNLH